MAGGLSILLTAVILSAQRVLPNPLWGPQGMGRNIRHLPCVSRKTGEAGTCMFAFSCAKMNGTHLGTCIDRFYFGSCCRVPEGGELDLAPPFDDNHLDNGGSSTTQRIRPAITQKPQTPRPPTYPPSWTSATSGRPTSSSSSSPSLKPVSSSTWAPPASSSTARPALPSSTWVSSSGRPSSPSPVSSTTHWTNRPASPSPTTTVPTLVTWTTLEEAPSKSPPLKPQAEVISATPATHRPTLVTVAGTIQTPTKRPIRPSATPKPTSKPSSKPSSKPGSKPTNKPVKPVKPAPSTPRPSSSVTKPPSTTWIPVSVSTHAPSAPPKKPSTTKKPVTISTPKPTTVNQTVLNTLEVSSTGRPQTPSTTVRPSVSSVRPVSSTTRPITSTTRPISSTGKPPASPSTTHRPKPPDHSGSTAHPTTVTKPQRPISTTSRPVAEASTASVPITISTQRPPAISSPKPPQTTTSLPSSSTSWISVGTPSPWPSSTEVSSTSPAHPSSSSSTSSTPLVSVTPTTVVSLGSSSLAPSATTPGSSNDTLTTGSTPLPEINEVESFNMTNYKDVCGRRLFPEARVVGGQLSGFGKWPWQISLRQWRTSTYLHKCGAALLSENWAITAAHCVENVPPSDLLLRLGEHDLSTEEEPYGFQERRVQIVASHPQFDPRTFEYDLALLRFYEPVTFQPNIIPVCVPEDDTNFVGSMAFVTGWGRLYEDGPLPSILQEVSVPVINNTICETMYRAAGYIEHIPDIFICAGWKKGGFDSCEGDSGGPMVIQRPDRRWLLAGVISWGIGCAEPNQPGVYTRISQFRHWINQILQF
ncbi:hypothetical protein GE061_017842 [Apolygus lucorum]|uniref:Uncharacterized protein n=1 Tax=Apolygus lucorum TaxID=248454 RepID=A0A6A4K4A8_APOLU|nr:hypothetical protein GE061_017842 [Apolygus lucorum]